MLAFTDTFLNDSKNIYTECSMIITSRVARSIESRPDRRVDRISSLDEVLKLITVLTGFRFFITSISSEASSHHGTGF